MAKLTEKERVGFEKIIAQDMDAIKQTFMNQIKDFWAKARKEVEHLKGYDTLKKEKTQLLEEIQTRRDRIHLIEEALNSSALLPEQVIELGGGADDYGHYKGANFFGIGVNSQFGYAIVEYIRKHIDLEVPAKYLFDVGRACERALTMSGTFEEARESYEKFYSLDFRKYGVDIAPKIDEARNNVEALAYTGQTLKAGREVEKELIQYKKESSLHISTGESEVKQIGEGSPEEENLEKGEF